MTKRITIDPVTRIEGHLRVDVEVNGGKVSNARKPPMFSRLAIPYIPNNPPRWPEVISAVKNLVEVWAANAGKGERMGEWIERIGWERFFKLTDIPFTEKHIDDFTFAPTTFRSTSQFRL